MPGEPATTTRLSTKGQVILPAALRQRKGWSAGTVLVVEDTREGVLLRPVPAFERTRPEDVFGCLPYAGPPVSLADMDAAITAEVRQRRARGRY
jgi:AbrB family looped-hinge helix DNA binding protein